MENIEKVFNFKKVITIVLAISFLFTNNSYGIDVVKRSANANTLRLPLSGPMLDKKLFSPIEKGQGIKKHPLYAFLREEFKSSPSVGDNKIRDWTYMLLAHSHLQTDPLSDLISAIKTFRDEKAPVELTNYSSVILNYGRLEEYGATGETFSALLKAIESGTEIQKSPDYFVPGTLAVRESIYREQSKIQDKEKHAFLSLIGKIKETVNSSMPDSILPVLEDPQIPMAFKERILNELGFKDAEEFSKKKRDMPALPHKKITNILKIGSEATIFVSGSIESLNSFLNDVYLLYLYKHPMHGMHFKEKIDSAIESLVRYNTAHEGSVEDLQKIYENLREAFQHAEAQYNQRELAMFAKTNIKTILNKQRKGEDKKIDKNEISATIESMEADKRKAISERVFDKVKKIDQELGALKKDLMIATILDSMEKVNGLPRLLDKLDGADSLLKRYISSLFPFRNPVFIADLASCKKIGKYFEAQDTGKILSLEFLPVRGILAGIAIDTGSDCGRGKFIKRAYLPFTCVYLIREKASPNIPRGYAAFYEVEASKDAAKKYYLVMDVINPSTDLNLNGQSFLEGVSGQGKKILETSGSHLQGIYFAGNSALVSNRDSISKAADNWPTEENISADWKKKRLYESEDDDSYYRSRWGAVETFNMLLEDIGQASDDTPFSKLTALQAMEILKNLAALENVVAFLDINAKWDSLFHEAGEALGEENPMQYFNQQFSFEKTVDFLKTRKSETDTFFGNESNSYISKEITAWEILEYEFSLRSVIADANKRAEELVSALAADRGARSRYSRKIYELESSIISLISRLVIKRFSGYSDLTAVERKRMLEDIEISIDNRKFIDTITEAIEKNILPARVRRDIDGIKLNEGPLVEDIKKKIESLAEDLSKEFGEGLEPETRDMDQFVFYKVIGPGVKIVAVKETLGALPDINSITSEFSEVIESRDRLLEMDKQNPPEIKLREAVRDNPGLAYIVGIAKTQDHLIHEEGGGDEGDEFQTSPEDCVGFVSNPNATLASNDQVNVLLGIQVPSKSAQTGL